MVYPAISSRRMPYDIDGTEVATHSRGLSIANTFGRGIDSWLDSTSKMNMNAENRAQSWSYGNSGALPFWFFLPELREVSHIALEYGSGSLPGLGDAYFIIQGSADSSNGMDGTWETGVYNPAHSFDADAWRKNIFSVSFSGPVKCVRMAFYRAAPEIGTILHIHLYGQKAAGQTPDDIVFCNASTGAELVALTDWGDRQEGTTEILSFKVKNASSSKIANDINLQLNHADFTMSWSPEGPWVTVLDIATLGVGALSNTVYVRNKLEPPLLILGPYAARVIASVGSWS